MGEIIFDATVVSEYSSDKISQRVLVGRNLIVKSAYSKSRDLLISKKYPLSRQKKEVRGKLDILRGEWK